jgi:4-carboxymuconolactone decarboxylase
MSDKIRFRTLSEQDMSSEQQAVAQAIIDSPRKGIRGPFPALLRRPQLADATRVLGDCVRYNSSLSDRSRELAILMVVRHWNVDAEWASHGKIGREAGIQDAVLEAIEKRVRPSDLDPTDAAIYDICAELLAGQEVSDATFARALQEFGEVGVVDLVGAIAYYNYISTIMNAVANPLAEGVTRLPR